MLSLKRKFITLCLSLAILPAYASKPDLLVFNGINYNQQKPIIVYVQTLGVYWEFLMRRRG